MQDIYEESLVSTAELREPSHSADWPAIRDTQQHQRRSRCGRPGWPAATETHRVRTSPPHDQCPDAWQHPPRVAPRAAVLFSDREDGRGEKAMLLPTCHLSPTERQPCSQGQ